MIRTCSSSTRRSQTPGSGWPRCGYIRAAARATSSRFPPNCGRAHAELQRQLTEWNPDLRARAIEELIERAGDAALPDVFTALADGNADIRQRALDAALAAGLDVPLEQLQALTLNDSSPEVRLRALQALEERPDSASIIEAATHDPDANVRREAQSILSARQSDTSMNCQHGGSTDAIASERSERRVEPTVTA